MQEIETKAREISKTVEEFLKDSSRNQSNVWRRKLHSDVELLKIDVEETNIDNPELTTKLNELSSSLRLIPIKRPKKWFDFIEIALRFCGVSCSFFFFGTFFSLPILFIRMIDIMTNQDPFAYYSERLKMFIVWSFLFQSGIDVKVEGLKNEYFNYPCAIMSFTHASNLDGFFVAGTCPIRQLAFGKKELFLAPFFSWLSLAIGGIPVDRGNRDRAIGALRRSVESAKVAKVAIAIAPEGTRSTTGQLLQFKKGTFHIWEELRAPLIPFIIYGAFDLYPVGSWVNQTGKVTVRYLPPIIAENATRDEMFRKLRRTTLNAIKECPENVGEDISTGFWFASLFSNIFAIALQLYLLRLFYFVTVIKYQFPYLTISLWSIGVTMFITLALYVYYVYLVDLGGSKKKDSKDKTK